jgi:hypothetical protein
LVEADDSLIFDKEGLVKLLGYFINGEISESEMYYIIDALLLSENFLIENEHLVDILTELTDPIINGPLTVDIAKDAINQL